MGFIPPKSHMAVLLKDFYKPLVIEHIPTIEPKGESVLVKTIATGICHSDIHAWRGDYRPAGLPKKLPIVLSHEIVGTVVACGDGVPKPLLNRKVLVYPWQYEEEDEFTLAGLTQLGRKRRRLGLDVDGGLQEYVYVGHYRFLVDVEGLDDVPALAPLACAGLTTYRAIKKLINYVGPDDYVAIVGLGGLGSYAVQWVKTVLPYVNMIGVDVREEAIEFASKLARIDCIVNPSKVNPIDEVLRLTKGRGVRAVVDLVASPKVVATYINVLDTKGVYVLVGHMGEEGVTIPRPRVIRNELTIVGSYTGSLSEQHEVVNLARRGKINYSAVVTARYRLDEVNEAFKSIEEGRTLGRQVVVM
ncbi:MAG: zinc-binding dehydrogenase [Sulfolobales archaeon]|nr:zinc-binding dehydrogenase [Sulfolobales archaeon]MDW7969439.1 zinc-binding dehydrogenase [Sulfolobales archaeon]